MAAIQSSDELRYCPVISSAVGIRNSSEGDKKWLILKKQIMLESLPVTSVYNQEKRMK